MTRARDTARWAVEQERYWSTLSGTYDSFYASAWSRIENEWTGRRLSFIGEFIDPRILDLGCGTGLALRLLPGSPEQRRYTGVDISPTMAAHTAKIHGVETRIGAMDQLDWVEDRSVDVVLCLFSSASFAESPMRLFEEVARVLRPGGRAYISALGRARREGDEIGRFRTRGDDGCERSVPAHRFRSERLRSLATDAGLEVVGIEGMNALSGIAELRPLWGIGRLLAKIAPDKSHLIELQCQRPIRSEAEDC